MVCGWVVGSEVFTSTLSLTLTLTLTPTLIRQGPPHPPQAGGHGDLGQRGQVHAQVSNTRRAGYGRARPTRGSPSTSGVSEGGDGESCRARRCGRRGRAENRPRCDECALSVYGEGNLVLREGDITHTVSPSAANTWYIFWQNGFVLRILN